MSNTPNPTNSNQSTKPVAGVSSLSVKDSAEAAKTVKDEDFNKAKAEKDDALSAKEAKALEKALGDEAENDVNPLDLLSRLRAFVRAEGDPMAVISKLVQAVPADTPDEYVIGGHAGSRLMLGHLRALVARVKA